MKKLLLALTLMAALFTMYLYSPQIHENQAVAKEIKDPDGQIYSGEVNEFGMPHGKGTVTYNSDSSRYQDGTIYEGEWKDGKMHGQGVFRYASGNVYEGEWKDNKRHGQVVYRYADGDVYEGEYKDDNMHGQGVYTGPDGSILHNGEWRDGKPFGKSYPKDRCGWITKKGHIVPSWKRRYFTLKCGFC